MRPERRVLFETEAAALWARSSRMSQLALAVTALVGAPLCVASQGNGEEAPLTPPGPTHVLSA